MCSSDALVVLRSLVRADIRSLQRSLIFVLLQHVHEAIAVRKALAFVGVRRRALREERAR